MKTILFACLALLAACSDTRVPEAIDYGRPESWLAFPGLASPADLTPKNSGYSNLQQEAKADVFYVHPTTGMREDVQNVPIDDPDALRMGNTMLMAQATPFNAVGRIFAPRYRQQALSVVGRGVDAQQEPSNRAYADVRRAFEYYVAHHNGGRPFFLVGHSQGASHAQRLLSDVIQGTPLQRRLVAAYLPGQPLPRAVFENDLTQIPPCTRPAQTGCAAMWGTFGEGHTDFRLWEEEIPYWDKGRQYWVPVADHPLVNINPVSWDERVPDTDVSQHRGAVPFGVPATHFARVLPRLVAAHSDGRYVFVSPTPLPADLFNDGGVFGGTNYHVFDISLFWVDIRENARRRLAAFLLEKDKVSHPVITGLAAATAKEAAPLRIRIEAANLPDAFQAKGLPEGLRLDARSGEISGIPQRAGVYPVVVTATNARGSDTAELVLTVLPRAD